MKLELITREAHSKNDRAPLLFVHGSCHAAWTWDEHFLPYFAAHGFDAHAVSLRGHGMSEGREMLKRSSVADYVSDVAQIAATFTRPPVVIGHSLGGLVVQKYLEKHDAAPAAVLIASSPVAGMLKSGVPLFLKHPLLFTKVALTGDVHALYATPERATEFLFSSTMDKAKIARYVTRFGQESPRACFDMMFNLPRPRRIKTPMLVLGAERDRIVMTGETKRTAQAYGADMKIFSDMAHDMMLEDDWENVASFMAEWFEARGL
ncbi:MAG: lysophospholipase [Pyrinomonadaceae bacterium MAG19_C2-C3]|nr:lysophospholipase [Pyrinomonadaceae bacterium MAG19_C2-C3]